jgi:hypothetical protein
MAIIHIRAKPDKEAHNTPQIGMWATQCCHRDLYQIESQDQIDIILDDWDEGISHDVYFSKKEALIEIRKRWDDPNEIAMINKMLEGLE